MNCLADISKLEQQADLLMQNVSGWETGTLERIGKRIKKYGKLSLADVKSINNIAVVKQDMDAITKELARVTGLNISQIEQMYGDLLTEQHLSNQPLYDYRGKKFVPFAENRELQAIVKAYSKTTAETMVNLSKIGASNLGMLDGNGKFVPLQKMYTDVLDKAVMQVSTGATDFHTAMRDTIIQMGGSGIRVNYGSGVTRRLDTAVRQAMLYGAKQCSIEYNEMIGQELGCDGIEIDYHSNPRPSHEEMQGQQYSINGKKTINGVTYEDAYEKGIDGEGGLLNDYGCLHYKTPIILGISEPRYSPEELQRLKEQDAKTYEIDGKTVTGYEATQMQRRLETAVRNEKTTRDLAKASGDNALVKRCNERIKAYQSKYNEISEITGIQGDKKRMSVPRGTESVKSAMPKPKKNIQAATLANYNEYSQWAREGLEYHLEDAKEGWASVPSQVEAIESFEREIPHYMQQVEEAIEKFDFSTRTDSESVLHILEDGRFKSQIETQSSHGLLDVEKRKSTTSKLFTMGEESDFADDAYEIYGYLDNAPRASMYGDCQIIIKNENLFERTTFTVGDSLELIDSGADPFASLITEPNFSSYGQNVFSDSIPNAPQQLERIRKDFEGIAEKGHLLSGNYVELQFHGGVSVEDVDYIIMSKNSPHSSKIKELAEKMGVKIKWIK